MVGWGQGPGGFGIDTASVERSKWHPHRPQTPTTIVYGCADPTAWAHAPACMARGHACMQGLQGSASDGDSA